MPAFKTGTKVNTPSGVKRIRISAGPQRDVYVHQLVMIAMRLGQRDGFRAAAGLDQEERLEELFPAHIESVDHENGDSLDNLPSNLTPVSLSENTTRMMRRRHS